MKKNFLKTSFVAVLAGMCMTTAGCKDDNDTGMVSVDREQVTLDAVSATAAFTVSSNEAWGIYKSSGQDWLSVSPADGAAGDTEVQLSGAVNRDNDRDVVITIRTASGVTQEVRVVQGIAKKENSGEEQLALFRSMDNGTITKNVRISGVVTSERTNTDGRTVFLQDAGKNAICLQFIEAHDIACGEEIDVWVLDGKKEVVEKGLTRISGLPLDHIVSRKAADAVPAPEAVTIADLLEGGWDGKLVEVDSVEFMNIDKKYEGIQSVWNREKQELKVVTEAAASFKEEIVAQGNGAIVGNVDYLKGTPVLRIRSLEDVKGMAGDLIYGAFLVITEKEFVYSQGAHTQQINVTANGGLNWNISVSGGGVWCTVDKTSGQSSGSFTIRVAGNTGAPRTATITVSADNVEPQVITVAQKEINLIPNGDLEVWSDGKLPDSWDFNQGSKPVTSDYGMAAGAHSGDKCIQFMNFQNTGTAQTTAGYFVQEFPIEGGKTYRISYWGKITGNNVRYRIYSRWRTISGGGNMDNVHAAELRPTPYVDATGGGWQQYTVTLTAPAEAKYFNFDVRPYCKNSNGVNSSVYFDDFECVEVYQ